MPHLFSRVSGAEIVRALLAPSIATANTITTAAKRGGRRTDRGAGGGGGSGPRQGNTNHSMNRALKWAYAIRQSTGQTRNRPIAALGETGIDLWTKVFQDVLFFFFWSFTVFFLFLLKHVLDNNNDTLINTPPPLLAMPTKAKGHCV